MSSTRAAIVFCIALAMAVFFFYGVLSFPDSPIQPCPTGYCGKFGRPHTEVEFRAYREWVGLMTIIWPIGMLTLLVLVAPIFKK